MRRQLVKVLESHQKDVFSESVLRSFWWLGMPLAGGRPERFELASQTTGPGARSDARVIDLAQWIQERGKAART
jgi:hypothetical protein